MRNQKEIIEELKKFTPTEDGDWSEFVVLVEDLWKMPNVQAAYPTLLDLLVKYDDDYMECQWSIIHGMEHSGGYELDLVNSLRKKPVDITIMMVSRMINARMKKIAGMSIESLLLEILGRTDITGQLRDVTEECLERLRSK